jgi:hypothetical protein
MAETPDTPARPVLQVIRGDASPEEVAALLAVIAARSAPPEETPPRRSVGGWADPAYAMSPLPNPGPGAWRSSAWR